MVTRRTLVAGLLAVGTAAVAFANPVTRAIYPAPQTPLSLDGLPPSARFVDVTTADGLALKGIVTRAQTGKPLLLVFHGNASSAAGATAWFRPLIDKGYGVLAAEYRGYSGMPGRPDEAGLGKDADAFAALARTEASGAPIWLVGHSLGGGVALNLATRARFDLIVTIGTFTRIRDMTPGLARAFVPDAYRNEANVTKLEDPYLLVHGTADDVVPAGMGNALHRAASTARRTGASVVLIGEAHRPDAAKLLAAFDAAQGWRATGMWDAARLPRDVKLIPFGQGAPLNP